MEDVLNIWVTEAQPMEDYQLRLKFNDGSIKDFDCKPLIEKYPIFHPLIDKKTFCNITLDGWTVTWADGTLDIAPEHLYECSTHVPIPYNPQDRIPLSSAAEEPEKYGNK